jgi:hypothetical protein
MLRNFHLIEGKYGIFCIWVMSKAMLPLFERGFLVVAGYN